MIAIIPARGGSKELPGKNIKCLNGKPLIAYTIEAALKTKHISEVIVSTDDQEIAEIAKQYGAKIPFMRPSFLATDATSTKDVLLYTLNELRKLNITAENFILLQPTSPLRDENDITKAIELFFSKQASAVVSYCEEYHPIKWHKYLNAEGKLIDIFQNSGNQRQEESKTYFPNGAIYIYDIQKYIDDVILSEDIYAYIMPRNKSIDIDILEDFEYCEYLINKNR